MSLPIAIANERQAALAHPTLTAAYAADLVRALFVLCANVAGACAHAPQRLDWFLLPYDIAQRRFSQLDAALIRRNQAQRFASWRVILMRSTL